MVKKLFKGYKPEVTYIKLSKPCLVNKKCKHCGGPPVEYWYVRNPTMWFSPRKSLDHQATFVQKYWNRFNDDFYLEKEPKNFIGTSIFSVFYDHSYRPRLHRSRGTNPTFDTVEFLSCDCGKSNWCFSQKAVFHRPEIKHRQARYSFPQKFIG